MLSVCKNFCRDIFFLFGAFFIDLDWYVFLRIFDCFLLQYPVYKKVCLYSGIS